MRTSMKLVYNHFISLSHYQVKVLAPQVVHAATMLFHNPDNEVVYSVTPVCSHPLTTPTTGSPGALQAHQGGL